MRDRTTLLILMAVAGSADASPSTPTAPAVLAQVQQFYAGATQLTALFRQTVTNATFNQTTTSDGKVRIVAPAKLRFDYVDHAGKPSKSFVFDGKTLWLVDIQGKQIVQQGTTGAVLPAAVSFLTGGSGLATQFDVALATSTTYGGAGATVLELTPKQASAQYSKLVFVVEPSDGHVRESVVIDSNGDTNDFHFYEPDVTSPIAPTMFVVNPAAMPGYKLSASPPPPAAGRP